MAPALYLPEPCILPMLSGSRRLRQLPLLSTPQKSSSLRQSNLSALLVSFLTHAGLLGWIVAHPGPSQLNGAMPRSRAPLTVTLLAQESDNRPTANAAAVAGQSPPAPLTEAQPTQPEPANPPEIAQSEAQPATEENAERSSINLPLTYYPARALSRMPQAISKFEPQPPASGDNGIGGKLALRLWIDASGNLDQIIVIKNDLPPAFEEAALAAFRQMRFSPGEINGVAVGAQVEVVIEYADLLQQPGQGRPGSKEAPPLPAPPASSGERTSQEKTNSAAPIVRPQDGRASSPADVAGMPDGLTNSRRQAGQ